MFLRFQTGSKIYSELAGNYFDESDWDDLIKNLTDTTIKFYEIFKPYIEEYKKKK